MLDAGPGSVSGLVQVPIIIIWRDMLFFCL